MFKIRKSLIKFSYTKRIIYSLIPTLVLFLFLPCFPEAMYASNTISRAIELHEDSKEEHKNFINSKLEVTQLKNTQELEPNNSFEKAQIVSLPARIIGAIESGEDGLTFTDRDGIEYRLKDFFRFTIPNDASFNVSILEGSALVINIYDADFNPIANNISGFYDKNTSLAYRCYRLSSPGIYFLGIGE